VHRPRSDRDAQQISVDGTFLLARVSQNGQKPRSSADRILIRRSRKVKAGTANARLAPRRVMSPRLARRLLGPARSG